MPWHVAKSSGCPAGKPWAVIKDSTGEVVGCHTSEDGANKQLAALYASENMKGRQDMGTALLERRLTPLKVELRGTAEQPKIGGYASVFNKPSRNLGGFVEVVAPGFFNKSRGDGWPGVLARWNHEDGLLIGTSDAGTLRLLVDNIGLDYEADPPRSRADLVELVTRGDIRKSSFAFRVFVDGDEWSLNDQGYPLRTLLSGQLVDVAPVNSPAYTDTSAGLRSLAPEVATDMRKLGFGIEGALASIAAKMEAELDEVRKLSEEVDGLKKFFVRTDTVTKEPVKAKPRLRGQQAVADLLSRREDPSVQIPS